MHEIFYFRLFEKKTCEMSLVFLGIMHGSSLVKQFACGQHGRYKNLQNNY